ncbi:hypothetical protein OH76DRAFT_937115 [Lentinus brumalis]|uniref:Uncharacterized protein n=1 Tax=Lentinus brumalis TaxID=2498619 RepID=A0A371CZD1_9APHY|nr:hypothetical protein OH76DRAFT_937115 [Polyporus brumalis]
MCASGEWQAMAMARCGLWPRTYVPPRELGDGRRAGVHVCCSHAQNISCSACCSCASPSMPFASLSPRAGIGTLAALGSLNGPPFPLARSYPPLRSVLLYEGVLVGARRYNGCTPLEWSFGTTRLSLRPSFVSGRLAPSPFPERDSPSWDVTVLSSDLNPLLVP